MFLLIFAAAVAVIASDFGFKSWEDLMPYGVGAFILFGLGLEIFHGIVHLFNIGYLWLGKVPSFKVHSENIIQLCLFVRQINYLSSDRYMML